MLERSLENVINDEILLKCSCISTTFVSYCCLIYISYPDKGHTFGLALLIFGAYVIEECQNIQKLMKMTNIDLDLSSLELESQMDYRQILYPELYLIAIALLFVLCGYPLMILLPISRSPRLYFGLRLNIISL